MPRTRSLAWSELKIGIIAVIAIALAIMIIIAVGGQAGFTWQQYTLKTKFANVQGLKDGAVVRVAGVEVGKSRRRRLFGLRGRGDAQDQRGDAVTHHQRVTRIHRRAQPAR